MIHRNLLIAALLAVMLLAGCTPSAVHDEPEPQPAPEEPEETARSDTVIKDMVWKADSQTIWIKFDVWPGVWGGWKMYLDGEEVPMEGSEGSPVVRPDAPVEQPPTGLVVGTIPWPSGLGDVDFPCCGTLQFDIPGQGLTNLYEYNLGDFGCATASGRACATEWTVHSGDLVVEGRQTQTIEGENFYQKGNVYIRDGATLIIRDTQFVMARGDVPTVHVYFFVDPGARLIIESSEIREPTGGGTEAGLICVINRGTVEMRDSPTGIHYFDMAAGASFVMVNSSMVNPIGGLLQVSSGEMRVTDSTLGALGLTVPAGAHLNVSGLYSGVYYDYWDVHEIIPEADYDLVLTRTTILKDDLTGNLEHGPYERGWLFFLDPAAHVRLADSELRKVFIDINNDTVAFENLRVGVPSSLTYRDIVLTDIIVMGQWPFTITDSAVTITNSDYLFLQPSGDANITLIDSHMVEFIPREFTGTMTYENALWTEAGEIIGGVAYHSNYNDFSMRGSLRIEGLRGNLQWHDARVTREFTVTVTDATGAPVSGLAVRCGGNTYSTNQNGTATFDIIFTEANYDQPAALEVWRGDSLLAREDIDFFTETPLAITLTS